MADKKILERLRVMREISISSASVGERQAAKKVMQQLMAKHGISDCQIPHFEIHEQAKKRATRANHHDARNIRRIDERLYSYLKKANVSESNRRMAQSWSNDERRKYLDKYWEGQGISTAAAIYKISAGTTAWLAPCRREDWQSVWFHDHKLVDLWVKKVLPLVKVRFPAYDYHVTWSLEREVLLFKGIDGPEDQNKPPRLIICPVRRRHASRLIRRLLRGIWTMAE